VSMQVAAAQEGAVNTGGTQSAPVSVMPPPYLLLADV
jgi:hypothetical protein